MPVSAAQRFSLQGRPLAKNGFRHGGPHSPSLVTGIDRACRCLLGLQAADGHWCGELQGDTLLESEYVLLMAFLSREGDERVRRAAHYVQRHQMAEGGWNIYPSGPADLSASVKAYFALK